MKVNDVTKANELSSSKVKKTSQGADFASYLQNVNKTQTASVSAMNNISSMDAIFATQMVDDVEEREKRKKLVKRGYTLLDKLEEIRDALLIGSISMDKLIEISRLVKEHKNMCDDPKLLDIIAEIELRVEVELAKLTK